MKTGPDVKGMMQVQLTIPMPAMMQLSALMYYLKQNLKLFCHIPNYAESRPEGQFQDILDNKQQAITDGQAFLYIRPSHGKGINVLLYRFTNVFKLRFFVFIRLNFLNLKIFYV